jgi:predicted transcriptional regulator
VPNTVVKLSPASRRVLYYLIDNSKVRDGEKRITVLKGDIAAQIKISSRQVARSLRKLESLGYITTNLQVDDEGRFDASEYIIHPIDAPFAEKLLKLHHDQQRVDVIHKSVPKLVLTKKNQ